MKKELKILLLSAIFFDLAAGLIGPIYAIFVEEIGGDLLTAGSSFAIFSMVSGILIFFVSKIEDKIKNTKKFLILGRLLGAIGLGGYILVENPLHLFIVQAILGLSVAIKSPAFSAVFSKNLDKGKYASEWGMLQSIYYVSIGVAAIGGGYIAQELGFKVLFWIMFILSIISFIITSLLLNIKKQK